MPTKEDVLIPLGSIPAYEAAATLFGVLAFPTDQLDRDRFANSICFKSLEDLSRDADFANRPRAIRPAHLLQDARQVDSIFHKGHRIINGKRLIAAKMASPFLAAHMELPESYPHPPTGNRVIASVAKDIDERNGKFSGGNAGNMRRRIWSESKPIIHLCLALHKLIHKYNKPNEKGLNLGDFILDKSMVRDTIIEGADLLSIVRDVFDIRQEEQVAVVLT